MATAKKSSAARVRSPNGSVREITSEGQARLVASGATLMQIASCTEASRQSASRWLAGAKKPETPARIAIAKRWPTVEPHLWDVVPDAKKKRATKAKSKAAARQGQAEDFRARVHDNIAAIDAQLRAAEAEDRQGDVAKFLGLKQRALMDAARFAGELSSLDEAKLTATARFVEVRQTIAKALVPFPEAARAVVEALERLGA